MGTKHGPLPFLPGNTTYNIPFNFLTGTGGRGDAESLAVSERDQLTCFEGLERFEGDARDVEAASVCDGGREKRRIPFGGRLGGGR